MRQIGFFIDHHFTVTSHFKGCHDGIGDVAKNAMRRERFGTHIMGADGVVIFLQSFFLERRGEDEEGMRKYFAKWSPYRIRKVRVRLIGNNEIYRPGSELAGIIEGAREMYHFVGANTPKCDASTTTDGLHEVDAEEPVSGEEEVVVRKVIRKYRVKTRLASCFCSSCQISIILILIGARSATSTERTYPAPVPAMINDEVKETVIMDTGVEPEGVDEPEEIKFRPRAKNNARC